MTHRLADAPQRAHTSFTLSMGLVNLPLAVLSGTESTRVERKEFVEGDVNRPVGRQPYDKSNGEVVEQQAIVRMAQGANGAWVVLTDDEIAEATMPKGVAEVIAFVPANKVHGNYVTEKVDQVRAKTSGLNAAQRNAANAAFATFLAGLRETKTVALVCVALRGPARYAGITADGDFLQFHTADAIRQPAPLPQVEVPAQASALMTQLIASYPKGVPTLKDTTAVAVQAFVDAKAEGVEVVAVPEQANPTYDLMAALTASVDAAQAAKGVAV